MLLSICLGQDVSFLALLLAIGLLLRKRDHEFAAGMVFSLLSIKLHLFLLSPLLLCLKREFRILLGIAAGGILLVAANFAWAGPNWVARNWQAMMSPVKSPAAEIMPNLHGLDMFLGGTGIAEVILIILVVAAVWVVVRSFDFEIALAACLIGCLLVSHHSYAQDAAILIPAFLAILARNIPIAGVLALACLTPIVYLLELTPRLGFVTPLLFTATLFALAREALRGKIYRERHPAHSSL